MMPQMGSGRFWWVKTLYQRHFSWIKISRSGESVANSHSGESKHCIKCITGESRLDSWKFWWVKTLYQRHFWWVKSGHSKFWWAVSNAPLVSQDLIWWVKIGQWQILVSQNTVSKTFLVSQNQTVANSGESKHFIKCISGESRSQVLVSQDRTVANSGESKHCIKCISGESRSQVLVSQDRTVANSGESKHCIKDISGESRSQVLVSQDWTVANSGDWVKICSNWGSGSWR